MLTLHRSHPDPFADQLEERLENLVLAYTVETDSPGEPWLTQSGHAYRGRDEVLAFLDALEEEVRLGRQFQSDACYLDPDDPRRCL